MVNYINVLHVRSMYKIESRGGGKNRSLGNYPKNTVGVGVIYLKILFPYTKCKETATLKEKYSRNV